MMRDGARHHIVSSKCNGRSYICNDYARTDRRGAALFHSGITGPEATNASQPLPTLRAIMARTIEGYAVHVHMALLPTYVPGKDPPFDAYYQQVLSQVSLAEELGWECFWFTEHHFILYGGLVPNPAVMMATAAGRTSRIRLGSSISILPLHHPLQTAEDYAMVDVASGGRLEFGIGLGNTPADYAHYGIPQEQSRARFEEAVQIIEQAWSQERFSHHGEMWNLEDVTLFPRPVQQPHPPIWVAGFTPQSLGWAGRQGYNIMTVAHPRPPESARAGVQAWCDGLRENGVDRDSRHCQLHVRIYVDEDSERARHIAENAIRDYTRLSTARLGDYSTTAIDTYDWEGMRAQGRNIYGNPDEVIQGIRATMRNFEFDTLTTVCNFGGISHDDIVQSMRLLAREVLPAFR